MLLLFFINLQIQLSLGTGHLRHLNNHRKYLCNFEKGAYVYCFQYIFNCCSACRNSQNRLKDHNSKDMDSTNADYLGKSDFFINRSYI